MAYLGQGLFCDGSGEKKDSGACGCHHIRQDVALPLLYFEINLIWAER